MKNTTLEPALLDILSKFADRYRRGQIVLLTIHSCLSMGIDQMKELSRKTPTLGFVIGTGPPHYVMTRNILMAEGVKLLEENPEPQAELIQGQLIQWWYEFLEAIYKWAVDQHLGGTRTLPARVAETLKVNMDLTETGTLQELVASGAVRAFNFQPSDKKFDLVLQVLGVRCGQLSRHNQALLKRHVRLRNILEHHDGVVSSRDLLDLGGEVIIYDKTHHPIRLAPGMRVEFSIWEVLRAARHIGELADEMVTGRHPPEEAPVK